MAAEKRIAREIVLHNAVAGVTVRLDDGQVTRNREIDTSQPVEHWREWDRVHIAPTIEGKPVMILRSAAGIPGPETSIPTSGGITCKLSDWQDWAAVEFRGAATVFITMVRGPLATARRL